MAEKQSGFFKWFGSLSGRFYNTHQEWQKLPEWAKQHYRIEAEQHCGDIDTFFSGAMKGLAEGTVEYAKMCPEEAAKMGADVANKVGLKPENGVEFAEGFLSTAKLEK
ncbi:uncharacterized protein LOC110249587 [Exaiptasia diaphana]|uniref:Uncharacterized protein n=1 Tax=Exaiptasia diaphana TaxID=2652724 RepID=A0A913XYL8_EXADI|nr:uncharacterized protein LOC110249587 [Exaiptasia diaphana]KXJ07984.1 hypothetical protein AC249_AIPGENE604 [Exaiptasia diaphana]